MIREELNEDDPHFAAARAAFELRHPDRVATSAWVRARERDRVVLAILYTLRGGDFVFCGVPPHALYGVSWDRRRVEELPRTRESPYVIRGLK